LTGTSWSGQGRDHSGRDHRYKQGQDQPEAERPWRPSQRPYVATACVRQAATDHSCPLYPALHREGAVLRQAKSSGCRLGGSAPLVHVTIMREVGHFTAVRDLLPGLQRCLVLQQSDEQADRN
jgi:hypothetical protein